MKQSLCMMHSILFNYTIFAMPPGDTESSQKVFIIVFKPSLKYT